MSRGPPSAVPGPPHRSWSRSCVSFSRAFRCRMHTSFCCSGVRYCSGVGGLMPWLSLHSVYFMERLQGDACQQGGTERAARHRRRASRGQGDTSRSILVPWHHRAPGQASRQGPGLVWAGEYPALLESGFYYSSSEQKPWREDGELRAPLVGGGGTPQSMCTSLAPRRAFYQRHLPPSSPSGTPERALRRPVSQPGERVWGWRLGWEGLSLPVICMHACCMYTARTLIPGPSVPARPHS